MRLVEKFYQLYNTLVPVWQEVKLDNEVLARVLQQIEKEAFNAGFQAGLREKGN